MSTKTIYPLRIPHDLKNALEATAARNRRTLAWTIRDILEQYVNTEKLKTQNDINPFEEIK